jgi:hypothetical protein
MCAEVTAIFDIWRCGAISRIEEAIAGSPDAEERRRRLETVHDWIRSAPGGAWQAIQVGVDSTVNRGLITNAEANWLREP